MKSKLLVVSCSYSNIKNLIFCIFKKNTFQLCLDWFKPCFHFIFILTVFTVPRRFRCLLNILLFCISSNQIGAENLGRSNGPVTSGPGQRKWVFATNSNFLIPLSLQPNVVELRYFKLRIRFDQKPKFEIKSFTPPGCIDIGIRKFELVPKTQLL